MRRAATSSAPTTTDPAGTQQRAWHGKKNLAQLDDPFPGQGVFHGGLPCDHLADNQMLNRASDGAAAAGRLLTREAGHPF